jgi:hypothetical protein
LPFYKITISLKKSDQSAQKQAISVIREYEESDLDRVWHAVHVKCEQKWGRKLNSFDCVRISKRSPDYLKYVKDKQQKKFNNYDDILSPVYIPMETKANSEPKRPQSVNGKYRNQKD